MSKETIKQFEKLTMEQFEEDWAKLSEGLQQIYAGQQLPPNRYMDLYTHVFNNCSRAADGKFKAKELYDKLKAIMVKHVNNLSQQLDSAKGEKFLEGYLALWNVYKFGSCAVNGVFSYLNRHWIKMEIERGNKEVCEVYDLAMNTWKTELFDKHLDKIKQSVLVALIAEENGSAEDKVRVGKLIKAVSEAFFGIGIEAIFGLMSQPEEVNGEGSSSSTAKQENYQKYYQPFVRQLLAEANKRLRGAPAKSAPRMPQT